MQSCRRRTPHAALLSVLAAASAHCTASRGSADAADVPTGSEEASVDAGTDIGPPTDALADVTDAGLPPEVTDAAPPPPPFDWIGIVGTGQSLSVGAEGVPRVSSVTRYRNLALQDPRADGGAWGGFDAGTASLQLVPLREPVRATYPGFFAYPNNLGGETPHTAMADQITTLSIVATGQDLVTVHSIVGVSTEPLAAIRAGGATNSYTAALWEGRIFADRAQAAGKTFGYGAIVLTHGEADQSNPDYGAQVYSFWTEYNRDLRAITGQSGDVPMLLSQQSSVPWPTAADAGVPNPERSTSTLAQWRLGVDHPGQIVCVGPKYQYAPSAYVIHLTPEGYQRLGIKYAQVFYEVVVRHRPWAPLQPTGAQRSGRTITLDFHVPVGPMAFDPNIAPPHGPGTLHPRWANGHGFEAADSTGDLAIESVQIVGERVVVTLAAAPTGTSLVVRYAMTPERDGFANGPVTGRRGQLRDSDPFIGIDQQTVHCQVTRGSTMVTAATGANFATVGAREVVTGPGIAPETIVRSVVPPTQMVLDRVWPMADDGMLHTITSGGRSVAVTVTNNNFYRQATLTTTPSTGGFIEMDTGFDVTGDTVPAGTKILRIDPPTQLVLSSPWTGETGAADLTFYSDQRNYCVQFEMPVP